MYLVRENPIFTYQISTITREGNGRKSSREGSVLVFFRLFTLTKILSTYKGNLLELEYAFKNIFTFTEK